MGVRATQLRGEAWINSSEKRAMDITLATAMLPLVVPVAAIALGLSRIMDGKGAIFRQERIGRGGQKVLINKIRTMRPEENGYRLLTPNERITALGRVIRPVGIDETPQIVNVFNGTMSLVGPRIWRAELIADMQAVLDRDVYEEWEDAYHRSKPGIVSTFHTTDRTGDYDEVTLMVKAVCDVDDFYNASLAHDLGILKRTGGMVARHALGMAREREYLID